jgi:hypothetical protein
MKLNKLGGCQVARTKWLSRFTNHATTKVLKSSMMVNGLHEYGDLQVTQIGQLLGHMNRATSKIQKGCDCEVC